MSYIKIVKFLNVHVITVRYKSDWSSEFEALKKTLLYYKCLGLLLCIVILVIIFVYMYEIFHIYEITKDIELTMILLTFPIIPIFLRFRPKIYSVTERGVVIDGDVHGWENFEGYLVDECNVYLKPYFGTMIALPKAFEPIVSEHLERLD